MAQRLQQHGFLVVEPTDAPLQTRPSPAASLPSPSVFGTLWSGLDGAPGVASSDAEVQVRTR